jgi:hypothetical protein
MFLRPGRPVRIFERLLCFARRLQSYFLFWVLFLRVDVDPFRSLTKLGLVLI